MLFKASGDIKMWKFLLTPAMVASTGYIDSKHVKKNLQTIHITKNKYWSSILVYSIQIIGNDQVAEA